MVHCLLGHSPWVALVSSCYAAADLSGHCGLLLLGWLARACLPCCCYCCRLVQALRLPEGCSDLQMPTFPSRTVHHDSQRRPKVHRASLHSQSNTSLHVCMQLQTCSPNVPNGPGCWTYCPDRRLLTCYSSCCWGHGCRCCHVGHALCCSHVWRHRAHGCHTRHHLHVTSTQQAQGCRKLC